MKKRIQIIAFILFLTGCTGNFAELNINPNDPEKAPLTNVLAYAIEEIASLSGEMEMKYPAAFVGYVTKGTYTDVTNYLVKPKEEVWSGLYTGVLTNLDYVIAGAAAEKNQNLRAAALVLKAFALHRAVDIYGKVPCSEAGRARDGLVHPRYDDERFIYKQLFQILDTAQVLFDPLNGGEIGTNDLLYGGDAASWQKFANSLRLRMAIRLSDVDRAWASDELTAILSQPTACPVMAGNADNAGLSFPGGDRIEPWTDQHNSVGDSYMAKPIIDTLIGYNDPRLGFYAEAMSNGSYRGLEVGTDADTEYSRVNDRFVNNPSGTVWLMKFAEVELIRAEAIARGFVQGNARLAYERAIAASCREYGIHDSLITAYLNQAMVAWHGDLKQIHVQKWIALFRQGWEAWAEMRRTDVPNLTPATRSAYSGHNRTPFRFPYPDSEKKLNAGNLPVAVAEDDYFWGYQIWWDTRNGVK